MLCSRLGHQWQKSYYCITPQNALIVCRQAEVCPCAHSFAYTMCWVSIAYTLLQMVHCRQPPLSLHTHTQSCVFQPNPKASKERKGRFLKGDLQSQQTRKGRRLSLSVFSFPCLARTECLWSRAKRCHTQLFVCERWRDERKEDTGCLPCALRIGVQVKEETLQG